MNPLILERCHEPRCSNFATVVGSRSFAHCLRHLNHTEHDRVQRLFQNASGHQNSVFDGRHGGSPRYTPLPYSPPKGADLAGSVFVAIDLSSADFEGVNFSFCNFFVCDLRRARLYNASLRWAQFYRSLLRQADINNSDGRWLRARSPRSPVADDLSVALNRLATKLKKVPSEYLHLVGREDAPLFFRRFGYVPEAEDNTLFATERYDSLNGKIPPAGDPQPSIRLLFDEFAASDEYTDWSGAALRYSDLSYSCFDHTEGIEVCFDGSDLHEATFNNAVLQRSSFLNVSFSRSTTTGSVESRFQGADLSGCILDGTNLEGLYFDHTTLDNGSLKSAQLKNALFFYSSMTNATLDDVVADGCCFFASTLTGSSFRGANLGGTTFWWDGSPSTLSITLEQPAFDDFASNWESKDDDKRRTTLVAVNFQAASLDGALLNRCYLDGALFQGASLARATLWYARCLGAQFAACNVDGVDFTGADLTSCDLTDAGVSEIPPNFDGANLQDATLARMNLSQARFVGTCLSGSDFSDCRLTGAHFESVDDATSLAMERASLRNADLDGAVFYRVNFSSSDLSFCHGRRVKFALCSFYMAGLRGSHLTDSSWLTCDLTKADLSDSEMVNARFLECSIEDASFRAAGLYGFVIIRPTKLSGADFSGASIWNHTRDDDGVELVCAIQGDEPSDGDGFKALLFDSAEIKGLFLSNIRLSTASFRFSSMELFVCEHVAFSYTDFSLSSLTLGDTLDTHFFYCNFSNANVSGSVKVGDLNVFLGCNFEETGLPRQPDGMLFADCAFRLTSFLASPDEARHWLKALFVHCRFSDLKYYGLADAEDAPQRRNWQEPGLMTFKTFMHASRLAPERLEKRLRGARSLVERYPKEAGRLEVLIPDDDVPAWKTSYGLARTLCREFRKDFLSQGLSHLASVAYVQEMDFFRKTLSPSSSKSMIDLDSRAILGHARRAWDDFSHTVISFILESYCCVLSASLIISFISSFLAKNYFSVIAFVPPLFIIAIAIASARARLLITKHLYGYGESGRKIIFAGGVCVASFAMFYWAFVPTSPADTLGRPTNQLSIFAALTEPAKDPSVGYLWADDTILHRSSDARRDADVMLTCLYFSGVTFTTLGYGDIAPNGIVRVLAMLEAGLGAFLMALFVFTFTRRNALR